MTAPADFPPCIDCGEEPGSLPGGRCRECDLDYVCGVCWCCKQQIERFEFNAKNCREFFGLTEVPAPIEAVGHAPDCAAEKARRK